MDTMNINFLNDIIFKRYTFNEYMVKISERGYEYKRIDNGEKIKNDRYKTNLYVDRA